jgi:ABC-type Fe3+/spermidine/putrescine transport system ATPase subunit
VLGFLGPKGAGKTTIIRLLVGLAEPTAGHARVLGLDRSSQLPQIKKQIGIVPEASNLYDELTVFDWLLLFLAMILSAAALSAMGALVSVAVKEVFEAQTLANAFRFPMMFLGGVFVPVASLPLGLHIVARFLPLTYAAEVPDVAAAGGSWVTAVGDIVVLATLTAIFFGLAAY